MGLPDNLKYEPTAHFRQRLAERFNIHGMGWRLFMRKLYPKLHLTRSNQNAIQRKTTSI